MAAGPYVSRAAPHGCRTVTRLGVGLLLIVVALTAGWCVCAVPPAQRAALVDLYSATNGTGWTDSGGWLVGDPCCNATGGSWDNIGCDVNCTTVTYVAAHARVRVWRQGWR
jgi:hypothetical protein